jgi:hypothetical protein
MLLACQPAGLKEKEGSLRSLSAQTAFLFSKFTNSFALRIASFWRLPMAAAPDDLCTVAELKSWLPNQGNNDDVTLQGLITNASLQVLQYIDRPHILSSVLGPLTENYDGNGSDRLLPRNFPITAVSSVSIDGVNIQAATTPTTAGYLWDGRRILLRGFRFCRGVQNVQLSYSAGYPSVPLDLKQAAIEAFALTYRQRVRIGEKSNSMSGQVNVSFDMGDVPPRSMAIFSQYRRLAL